MILNPFWKVIQTPMTKSVMAEQLIFDLPLETAFGRQDFFVTGANATAVSVLENWQSWPMGKLVLSGPKGSGKTHLSNIWAELTGARVIDAMALLDVNLGAQITAPLCVENMHQIAGISALQEAAFHLHNMMMEQGQTLLFTGVGIPGQWGITLPDLLSRLQGSSLTELALPDDSLLCAVMLKQFSDRQIKLDPKVMDFLMLRMERSFETVSHLVSELDRQALVHRKPITLGIARRALDQLKPVETFHD